MAMKMRASSLVFVTSVLSLLPFVACDDPTNGGKDGGNDGTAPGVDGSQLPAEDAGLPDNYIAQQDAGQGAGQDAGPPTTATVVVTKSGAPDVGVSVVFQDVSGALVSTVVTGVDGKATSTVAAGGQLTVALGAAGSRQLVTYLGLKPGDVINVAERVTRAVSITQTMFAQGGGDSIAVGNSNCSTNSASTGNVVLVDATPECISGATFPVFAQLNFMGANYFSFKKQNALAASGTTNVSGLSAWATGAAFSMGVMNAPNLPGPSAVLGQIANDQSYATSPDNSFALAAGMGNANFSTATGYADAFQGEVQFTSYAAGFQQTVTFAKRVASNNQTELLDLGGGLLPALTGATATPAGARPVVAWTAAASLSSADSGVLELMFQQPVDGAPNESIDWTFIVPPGTLTVTAPQLPAQLVAFQPSAASILNTPAVAFFESDLIPSYDFVRQQAGAFGLTRVPLGAFTNLQSPALPAAGTLRITAIAPGG